MLEKNTQTFNCVELLLELAKHPYTHKPKSMLKVLPEEWQQSLAGKQVIFFSLGEQTLCKFMEFNGKYLKNWLAFIYTSIKHASGFVLWWYDDGKMLEVCKDAEKNKQGFLKAYEDFLEEISRDSRIIFDKSGQLDRAIEYADVYYGDNVGHMHLFMKKGKKCFKQALERQCLYEYTMKLGEWIDDVYLDKREMPLPAEWYVKIKGRRVLLYRIENAEVLFEGKLALSRLETVMKSFAGKSDFALWILNDTYLEQVVALMTDREKCLYGEMRDFASKSDNFIWDSSGNIDRAIANVDVLYGKQMVLRNWFEGRGRKKALSNLAVVPDWVTRMRMARVTLCEDKAYFVARSVNALMYVELSTKKVFLAEVLDRKNLQKDLQFSYLFHCNNKLILLPFFYTGGFMEYDIKKRSLREVPFPRVNKAKFSFINGVKYKDKVYFLSYGYPALAVYDVKREKYDYKFELYDAWKNDLYVQSEIQPVFWLSGATGLGGKLYIVTPSSNRIIVLEIDTMEYTYEEIGKATYGYVTIISDGVSLWLIQNKCTDERCLIRWNPYTKETVYVSYPESCDFSKVNGGYCGFANVVQQGDKIYFFPDMASEVLELDVKTNEIRASKWLNELIADKPFDFKWFDFAVSEGEYIYASMGVTKCLYKIDVKSRSWEEYPVMMPLDKILEPDMQKMFGIHLDDTEQANIGRYIYEQIVS